jgi:hypothetical protein
VLALWTLHRACFVSQIAHRTVKNHSETERPARESVVTEKFLPSRWGRVFVVVEACSGTMPCRTGQPGTHDAERLGGEGAAVARPAPISEFHVSSGNGGLLLAGRDGVDWRGTGSS